VDGSIRLSDNEFASLTYNTIDIEEWVRLFVPKTELAEIIEAEKA
jgi:hypothetical protein